MLKGVVRGFRFVSTYFFFFSFVLSLLLARPTIARLVEEAFNKKIRDDKSCTCCTRWFLRGGMGSNGARRRAKKEWHDIVLLIFICKRYFFRVQRNDKLFPIPYLQVNFLDSSSPSFANFRNRPISFRVLSTCSFLFRKLIESFHRFCAAMIHPPVSQYNPPLINLSLESPFTHRHFPGIQHIKHNSE